MSAPNTSDAARSTGQGNPNLYSTPNRVITSSSTKQPAPPVNDNFAVLNLSKALADSSPAPVNPYEDLPPLIPSVATYFPSADANAGDKSRNPQTPAQNAPAASPSSQITHDSVVDENNPRLKQPQAMFAGYYQPPNRLWQEDVDPSNSSSNTAPNSEAANATAVNEHVITIDEGAQGSQTARNDQGTNSARPSTRGEAVSQENTQRMEGNVNPGSIPPYLVAATHGKDKHGVFPVNPVPLPLSSYSLSQWLLAKSESGDLQRYIDATAHRISPSSNRWLLFMFVLISLLLALCGGVMSVGGWDGQWSGHGPLIYGEMGLWGFSLLLLLLAGIFLLVNVYNYGWILAFMCVACASVCGEAGIAVARVWHLSDLLGANIVYFIGLILLVAAIVILVFTTAITVIYSTRKSFTSAALKKYTPAYIKALTKTDAETAEHGLLGDINLLILELLRIQQSQRLMMLRLNEIDEEAAIKKGGGASLGGRGNEDACGSSCSHACAARLRLENSSLRVSLQQCAKERDDLLTQRNQLAKEKQDFVVLQASYLKEKAEMEQDKQARENKDADMRIEVEMLKLQRDRAELESARNKPSDGNSGSQTSRSEKSENQSGNKSVAELLKENASLQREVTWLRRESAELQSQASQALDLLVAERNRNKKNADVIGQHGMVVGVYEKEMKDLKEKLEASRMMLIQKDDEIEELQHRSGDLMRQWLAEREKLALVGIPMGAITETSKSADEYENVGVLGELKQENTSLKENILRLEQQIQLLRGEVAKSSVKVRVMEDDMVRFARETERVGKSIEKQVKGIKEKM